MKLHKYILIEICTPRDGHTFTRVTLVNPYPPRQAHIPLTNNRATKVLEQPESAPKQQHRQGGDVWYRYKVHCLITGQQRHWEEIRSNHGMVTYWIQTRVAQLTPYITTPVSVLKIPMETIRLCSSQGVLAWLLFTKLRCTVMKCCVGSPKVPHGTLELDPPVDSLVLVALTVHKESRITQGNSFQ